MVGAAGIEPATLGLEIRCSIRLSYAPTVLAQGGRLECRFTLAIYDSNMANSDDLPHDCRRLRFDG
jgi:hypothetical protein